MKQLLSIIAAVACLASCGTANIAKQVGYTEAHGYFVRNDAPPHPAAYYDTQAAFDSVFGCAAVMGKDGLPTTIDFTKQSVIAVIGGETNRPTEFRTVSLNAIADTLRLKYATKEGEPATYTMRPVLLLVINKPTATPNVRLERE